MVSEVLQPQPLHCKNELLNACANEEWGRCNRPNTGMIRKRTSGLDEDKYKTAREAEQSFGRITGGSCWLWLTKYTLTSL